MLNEERVKLMVKLASYEAKEGKEDFKISSYYKKDYMSINRICTLIWVTVGYAILAGIFGLAFVEQLLEQFTLTKGLILLGALCAGYVFLLILYWGISGHFYQKKHTQARNRIKRYSHNLLVLNKLYEKEKQ